MTNNLANGTALHTTVPAVKDTLHGRCHYVLNLIRTKQDCQSGSDTSMILLRVRVPEVERVRLENVIVFNRTVRLTSPLPPTPNI